MAAVFTRGAPCRCCSCGELAGPSSCPRPVGCYLALRLMFPLVHLEWRACGLAFLLEVWSLAPGQPQWSPITRRLSGEAAVCTCVHLVGLLARPCLPQRPRLAFVRGRLCGTRATPVRFKDSLRSSSCVLGGRLAGSQVASPADLGWGSWRRNPG